MHSTQQKSYNKYNFSNNLINLGVLNYVYIYKYFVPVFLVLGISIIF